MYNVDTTHTDTTWDTAKQTRDGHAQRRTRLMPQPQRNEAGYVGCEQTIRTGSRGTRMQLAPKANTTSTKNQNTKRARKPKTTCTKSKDN
eukprot:52458-Rhodomonas_salina.1